MGKMKDKLIRKAEGRSYEKMQEIVQSAGRAGRPYLLTAQELVTVLAALRY